MLRGCCHRPPKAILDYSADSEEVMSTCSTQEPCRATGDIREPATVLGLRAMNRSPVSGDASVARQAVPFVWNGAISIDASLSATPLQSRHVFR